MLVLPLPIHLDVVVLVPAGDPARAVVLAKSERPQQIPGAFRPVAIDLDARVEDIVLREADQLLKALEQLANRVVTLGLAEIAALPDAVLDEDFRDSVRIVIVVADIAIERLQLLDRLDIFELAL